MCYCPLFNRVSLLFNINNVYQTFPVNCKHPSIVELFIVCISKYHTNCIYIKIIQNIQIWNSICVYFSRKDSFLGLEYIPKHVI